MADAATAQQLAEALAVEARAVPEGSTVVVAAREAELIVQVEASDARTLRAASNSILRLVAVAVDVSRVGQRF